MYGQWKLLSSEEFRQHIGKELQNLLHSQDLTDVEVICQDRNFKCHKVFLAACSGFFYSQFTNENSANLKNVALTTVSGSTFKIILDFIYTGVLKIQGLSVEKQAILRRTLFILDMNDVLQHHIKIMLRALAPNSFTDIWARVSAYQMKDLERSICEYVATHLEECSKEAKFVHLTLQQLIAIVSNERLTVLHQNITIRSIQKWVHFDIATRDRYLMSIMAVARVSASTRKKTLALFDREMGKGFNRASKKVNQKAAPPSSPEAIANTPIMDEHGNIERNVAVVKAEEEFSSNETSPAHSLSNIRSIPPVPPPPSSSNQVKAFSFIETMESHLKSAVSSKQSADKGSFLNDNLNQLFSENKPSSVVSKITINTSALYARMKYLRQNDESSPKQVESVPANSTTITFPAMQGEMTKLSVDTDSETSTEMQNVNSNFSLIKNYSSTENEPFSDETAENSGLSALDSLGLMRAVSPRVKSPNSSPGITTLLDEMGLSYSTIADEIQTASTLSMNRGLKTARKLMIYDKIAAQGGKKEEKNSASAEVPQTEFSFTLFRKSDGQGSPVRMNQPTDVIGSCINEVMAANAQISIKLADLRPPKGTTPKKKPSKKQNEKKVDCPIRQGEMDTIPKENEISLETSILTQIRPSVSPKRSIATPSTSTAKRNILIDSKPSESERKVMGSKTSMDATRSKSMPMQGRRKTILKNNQAVLMSPRSKKDMQQKNECPPPSFTNVTKRTSPFRLKPNKLNLESPKSEAAISTGSKKTVNISNCKPSPRDKLGNKTQSTMMTSKLRMPTNIRAASKAITNRNESKTSVPQRKLNWTKVISSTGSRIPVAKSIHHLLMTSSGSSADTGAIPKTKTSAKDLAYKMNGKQKPIQSPKIPVVSNPQSISVKNSPSKSDGKTAVTDKEINEEQVVEVEPLRLTTGSGDPLTTRLPSVTSRRSPQQDEFVNAEEENFNSDSMSLKNKLHNTVSRIREMIKENQLREVIQQEKMNKNSEDNPNSCHRPLAKETVKEVEKSQSQSVNLKSRCSPTTGDLPLTEQLASAIFALRNKLEHCESATKVDRNTKPITGRRASVLEDDESTRPLPVTRKSQVDIADFEIGNCRIRDVERLHVEIEVSQMLSVDRIRRNLDIGDILSNANCCVKRNVVDVGARAGNSNEDENVSALDLTDDFSSKTFSVEVSNSSSATDNYFDMANEQLVGKSMNFDDGKSKLKMVDFCMRTRKLGDGSTTSRAFGLNDNLNFDKLCNPTSAESDSCDKEMNETDTELMISNLKCKISNLKALNYYYLRTMSPEQELQCQTEGNGNEQQTGSFDFESGQLSNQQTGGEFGGGFI